MKMGKRILTAAVLSVFVMTLLFPAISFAGDGERKDIIHGFRLLKQTYINSIQSTAMQFEHVKTGAKLIYLKNDDSNKVFSINFRTPPSDDTGVNHIIEHSVLDGSKDFPVKSMFTTMESRSMATFLNAFTGNDNTSYVAASKNEKDFRNLLNVYMNAVFYPNVLTNKNIFLQEGGRFELASPDAELKYNGVVYNEVRAVGSPLDLLYKKAIQSLLPGSIYQWNSGGDPLKIPTLTYEKLVSTYNRYYHPSNCYIYLYGALDLENTLDFLDSQYLSRFNKKAIYSNIELQKPLKKSVDYTYEYDVSKDESIKNKAYLSLNYILDKATNTEVSKAFDMITELLLGNGDAPLSKALAAKGFTDVYVSSGSMLQPIFSIICENSDENRKKEFKKVIEDELKKIISEGISKKDISSLLRSYELSPYMEATQEDRGIHYNNRIMSTWLYGGDTTSNLGCEMNIAILKKALKEKYLEKLIKKYLIDSQQKSMVVLKPVQKPENSKDRMAEWLASYKSKLSKEQINDIILQGKNFIKWQSEPDSAENISKMPTLELSDLRNSGNIMINPQTAEKYGIKILYTPVDTGEMSYLNLYFDTSAVPQDKIPYLKLLEAMLGKIGTEKYKDISKELQSKTAGDLGFYNYHFGKVDSVKEYSPKMMVYLSTLDSDLKNTIELLNQILTKTRFDGKELLKKLVHEQKAEGESLYTSNYMGSLHFMTYISEKDQHNEYLNGIPYYQFLWELDNNFDKKWNEFEKNITEVYKSVFNRNNLVLGFVGSNKQLEAYKNELGSLLEGMSDQKTAANKYSFTRPVTNEGIVNSRSVNSVIEGYNLKKLGYEYSGSMQVLADILNEYLYSVVRAQGGAYGTDVDISRDGNIVFSSARDPHIRETLASFSNLPAYLRNFNKSTNEMKNYIIGTVSRMSEAYASTNTINKARVSQQLYLMGETEDSIKKEMDQILSTTAEDISNYADVIDSVLKQNCFCVAGGEAGIKAEEDLFKGIIYTTDK